MKMNKFHCIPAFHACFRIVYIENHFLRNKSNLLKFFRDYQDANCNESIIIKKFFIYYVIFPITLPKKMVVGYCHETWIYGCPPILLNENEAL